MASNPVPQVTIILPTYNRVRLLSRAIESVRRQTFTDWELFIIDDASTDETSKALREWQVRDPRIKVFHNEINQYPDISKILNQGLVLARSQYIARLDDDDWWCDSDKLKKQVDFLENHPEYVVVGTGVIVVNGAGRELYRYLKNETDVAIRRRALFANPFTHPAVLYRREEAVRVGGYGDWHYAEDWALWLELGKSGKFYNLPQYLTCYTMAGQNKSWIHQRLQTKTVLEIIKKHRSAYPNFWPARLLGLGAYFYTFLPKAFRDLWHPLLVRFKRTI